MAETRAHPGELALRALASEALTRHYSARTIVLSEQDHSDSLYFILKGRIKAYGATGEGREVVYDVLGPGEMFGELSVDGGDRSASVMTLEPTCCAILPGAQVRRLVVERPEVAQYLILRLVRMIRRMTATVKQLALGDASDRLTQLLRTLARPGLDGVPVVEGYTQQELAERIGCSREMVSRIVKRLATSGQVRCERRRIVLLGQPRGRLSAR